MRSRLRTRDRPDDQPALHGLSAAFREINAADGRAYLTQYFERARFEYHPEHVGTAYELLGLLGNDLLRAKGWLA